MIWHHTFKITGEANNTIFDPGIESSEKEPKRLLSILVQVSAYQENDVEGWIEKTKIFSVKDKLIDTIANTASANMQYSGQRINEIPVEIDLAVGERFKAAIRCGGTATDLIGAYIYELIG